MSTQAYYHRLRRIYDLYLFKYHEALGPAAFDTPDKITAQNDFTMLTQIFHDANHGIGSRRDWARRIATRDHHWEVFGTGVNADGYDHDRFAAVVKHLEQGYGSVFLIDIPDPIGIHKLLVPGESGTRKADRLQLVSKDGMKRPLTEESQILRTIPNSFRSLRIFADVPRTQPDLRKELKESARRIWQQEGGH
jgi:hypothetical protein